MANTFVCFTFKDRKIIKDFLREAKKSKRLAEEGSVAARKLLDVRVHVGSIGK